MQRTVKQLRELLRKQGIPGYSGKSKVDLIKLLRESTIPADTVPCQVKATSQPNSEVLTVCPIPNEVDIRLICGYASTYFETRLEFYQETNRKLYVEPEIGEWWLTKASGGKHVGGGSKGTDVLTSENNGIDLMCVSLNNQDTNEKSLMQNFKTCGQDLDTLFMNKKFEQVLTGYLDCYKHKLETTKRENSATNLYILAFISTPTKVVMICFKVDIDLIKGVCFNKSKSTDKNICTSGFISEDLGTVKLYKSKKRIELRLSRKCLESPHAIELYSK